MAIVPSINLSGLNLSGIGSTTASRTATTRQASASTRPTSASSAGRGASSSSTAANAAAARITGASTNKSPAMAGPNPGRPGRSPNVSLRSRDPNYPDLGPTAGVVGAPRPELTAEQQVAYEQQRGGYERGGASFGKLPSAAQTLARQMVTRRRGRRPGEFGSF